MVEAAPSLPPQGDGATAPTLAVTNLCRYFDVSPPFLYRLFEGIPRQILKAVDGIDFTIEKGRTFSLVGESGCGKSTVARVIVGLYAPTTGSVVFEDIDLAALGSRAQTVPLRRRMQMIFQDPFASLNPRWRVADIIAEPIRFFKLAKGTAAIQHRVGELLEHVGMSPADAAKYPHEFSGGQRQRISIARALASRPDFLICDEPTSALDVSVQAQILNLMKDLQRQFRLTYLFISHNLAVVYHMSDHIGVMYLGRLVEVSPAKTLFATPRHPYTRMLLDTILDLDMTRDPRMPMVGEVANPIHPPSGCHFHPRCPFAEERCRTETPLAKSVAGGSTVACHGVEEGRVPVGPVSKPQPMST